MPRFLIFQEHVVTTLLEIDLMEEDNKDDYLQKTLSKIKKVTLPTHLPPEIAETYAKAQVLSILGLDLKKSHYQALPLRQKILLHMLFKDSIAEQKELTDDSWKQLARFHSLRFNHFKEYAQGLAPFLAQYKQAMPPTSSFSIKEVQPEDKRFQDMDDVDMYETEGFKLSGKTMRLHGTSKLACCVALIVLGRDKNGIFWGNVSHQPSPTKDHIDYQNALLSKKGIRQDQMIEILVGGSLENLPETLQLALSRGSRMKLVSLGMSYGGFRESSSVVIDCDAHKNPVLYYATESLDSRIAGVQAAWWESDDEAESASSAMDESDDSPSSSASSSKPASKEDVPMRDARRTTTGLGSNAAITFFQLPVGSANITAGTTFTFPRGVFSLGKSGK